MNEDSGTRLSISCPLSSPASLRAFPSATDVPMRSPSACGGTSTALGLHQCGVGTRCRRRPGNVSLGAPSSRCSRAAPGSTATQPTPCIADLVDLWEGKQRETETDEVLMPEAMAACVREKKSQLALLTASPQRRTSKMAGRLRT